MLDDGMYASIREIGDAENISKSYVSRILRLALHAPDIIEATLGGNANQSLMLESLEPPLPKCTKSKSCPRFEPEAWLTMAPAMAHCRDTTSKGSIQCIGRPNRSSKPPTNATQPNVLVLRTFSGWVPNGPSEHPQRKLGVREEFDLSAPACSAQPSAKEGRIPRLFSAGHRRRDSRPKASWRRERTCRQTLSLLYFNDLKERIN
jgi:hypothetical protein